MESVTITSSGATVAVHSQAWRVDVASPLGSIGISTGILSGVPFSGPYEVTPSGQGQTLATRGKMMSQDVVVGAIPSNYGLITYDGSVITVS